MACVVITPPALRSRVSYDDARQSDAQHGFKRVFENRTRSHLELVFTKQNVNAKGTSTKSLLHALIVIDSQNGTLLTLA